VRVLGILRWSLPLALAAIALFVEWAEHLAEDEPISPYFLGELVIFAVVGPTAVWFTLGWVIRLVAAYQVTDEALRDTNSDLETIVEERTQHLRETTAQLEATNQDLAHANQELRQLDRMKSEFVSLVSHQLRAPLTTVNGALELVAQDAGSLPPSSQRTLRILVQETERLSRLIQTILDVSRLEAGRVKLHLGPVALEPLLAKVATETLGPRAERWHLEAASDAPPAWADEQLLAEVVRNLLQNADRYSPSDQPIDIQVDADADQLEVRVADHGPGVPPHEQARIFHSFHRVGDVDRDVAGYGLGLYFAERLIRAQHGTIGVESPLRHDGPDRGSCFWFRLPVAQGGPDEDDDAPWFDEPAGPD
jgi:signal transduction histidine kinase